MNRIGLADVQCSLDGGEDAGQGAAAEGKAGGAAQLRGRRPESPVQVPSGVANSVSLCQASCANCSPRVDFHCRTLLPPQVLLDKVQNAGQLGSLRAAGCADHCVAGAGCGAVAAGHHAAGAQQHEGHGLHVELLALLIDAAHEGQVRTALQHQLLLLFGGQLQYLQALQQRWLLGPSRLPHVSADWVASLTVPHHRPWCGPG